MTVYKERSRNWLNTMQHLFKNSRLVLIVALSLMVTGCVYYNTFYNARKAFNDAERQRMEQEQRATGRASALGGARRTAGAGQYNVAIEKSLKVIENYPSSSWYDDALYVLGVSYFHTGQFDKSERRLRELLANYEESEYVTEATLYLAKSKLQLGEEADAMMLFEEIFNEDFDRRLKAEAALGLGEFYMETGDAERAQSYFRAVRDSLGRGDQKIAAQRSIGDALYMEYQFDDALGAYLQLLGMNPENKDRYHALWQAADASYRMLRIDDGLDYLRQLMEHEEFYDSLGVIKLKVAEGYEMQEDLSLAEATYQEIAEGIANKPIAAQANYRLGLIFQFDYDSLALAKEYYDKAVELNRGSEAGQLALQRSGDIGKLRAYSQEITTDIDSTMTQDEVDGIAYTQYQLAELYWFQLNEPDSAIQEMHVLIDSFPSAYDAPRGAIALSQMYLDYQADTATADSLLNLVIRRYPHSDFLPEALELLGLKGTAADTGYAERYIHLAEDMLEMENYDSAVTLYTYVAERFPDSRYAVQARFNAIWVQDEYMAPGDSTLIFAYQEIVDSFPGTEWASEANTILTASTRTRQQLPAEEEGEEYAGTDAPGDELPGGVREPERIEGSYAEVQQGIYRRPNGDSLILLQDDPVLIEEEFEFPEEAYAYQQDLLILYFQILLDFSGKVVDLDLRVPSEFPQLNENAKRTVMSMTFDPLEVTRLIDLVDVPEDPSGRGHWFVYKYEIEKPDILR